MIIRLLSTVTLLCSAMACSTHSDSGAAHDGGEAEPHLSCPVSDSGHFEETPTGACMGVGSCAIELDNSCQPGVSVVPSTPPVYECRCLSNQWQCTVKSGGFGIVTCGDAGGADQG